MNHYRHCEYTHIVHSSWGNVHHISLSTSSASGSTWKLGCAWQVVWCLSARRILAWTMVLSNSSTKSRCIYWHGISIRPRHLYARGGLPGMNSMYMCNPVTQNSFMRQVWWWWWMLTGLLKVHCRPPVPPPIRLYMFASRAWYQVLPTCPELAKLPCGQVNNDHLSGRQVYFLNICMQQSFIFLLDEYSVTVCWFPQMVKWPKNFPDPGVCSHVCACVCCILIVIDLYGVCALQCFCK